MPKSKRQREVALTKTVKKTREWKEGLVALTRQAAEAYREVYVVRFFNMRTPEFKKLREELKADSKFVCGNTKLLQVALGRDAASEVRDGISGVCEHLCGQVGLFFTNKEPRDVQRVFDEFEHQDFAKAGARAARTVKLDAGPLEGPRGPLPHTEEPTLRKHGLPTKLAKGVVTLLADHELCRRGEPLSPAQAQLLKAFGVKLAFFRIGLVCRWREGEEVECFEDGESSEGEEGDGEGELEVEEFDGSKPNFDLDGYDGPSFEEVQAQLRAQGQ